MAYMAIKKLSAEELRTHKGVSFPGITTVFICHDGNGRIFLTRRSQNTRDEHGRWDVGGGGLKHGQSLEQNLRREVKEEYNVDPLQVDFVGYVEGRDIPKHPCDVLITDGFTGNVTLKVIEGWSEGLFHTLQKEVASESPELIAQLKPLLGRVMKRYDHEEYGGALLVGVRGLLFKVHGSAGAKAIKNAVAAAKNAGKLNLNALIEARLAPKT